MTADTMVVDVSQGWETACGAQQRCRSQLFAAVISAAGGQLLTSACSSGFEGRIGPRKRQKQESEDKKL